MTELWELVGKQSLKKGLEDNDRVLHQESLSYIPEVIKNKLISMHYDNPFVGHFQIDKTQEWIPQKYYWPTFCRDVEAYVTSCDICLTLKVVRHKTYDDLQLLPVLIHQ